MFEQLFLRIYVLGPLVLFCFFLFVLQSDFLIRQLFYEILAVKKNEKVKDEKKKTKKKKKKKKKGQVIMSNHKEAETNKIERFCEEVGVRILVKEFEYEKVQMNLCTK